jgi:hypothetical protein
LHIGGGDPIDREGNYQEYKNQPPFNASWNYDDNSSGNEVIFFGFEDGILNKTTAITYKQALSSFPSYAISETHVKVDETTPSGSISYSSGANSITFSGDGPLDIVVSPSGLVSGTYWNGSSNVTVNVTLTVPSDIVDSTLPPPTVIFNLASIQYEVLIDATSASFLAIQIGPPVGTYWQQATVDNGGKIGGLFYAILETCRDFRDGKEDLNGHPELLSLGYSTSQSVLGVWGLYGNEISGSSSSSASSSSSGPHGIPINSYSISANINIGDFLPAPASRSDFEGTVSDISSVIKTVSSWEIDACVLVHNILKSIGGYWTILEGDAGWCDPAFRLNGNPICCKDGKEIPEIYVTVSGNTSNITWCGKTWTPAQSGVKKVVCPSRFTRRDYVGPCNTGVTSSWFCGSREAGTWEDIQMKARWQYGMYFGPWWEYDYDDKWWVGVTGELHSLDIGLGRDLQSWDKWTYSPATAPTYTRTPHSDLNMIIGLGRKVGSLTGAFFGSYTDGNGVTYTWSKGNNWDNAKSNWLI